MQRFMYNLSNIINTCGHIGRLQTLQNIPVLPGDSLEFNFDSIVRLAPPRLDIVTECQVDICGFYVPMRHIYGHSYLEWIQGGPDAANIPSSGQAIPANGPGLARFNRNPAYLMINECSDTLPKHIVQGYNYIFQRFYAVKNTPNNGQDGQTSFQNLDFYPEDDPNFLRYGKLAARLPHIMNGGTILEGQGAVSDMDLDDADATVTGVADGGAGTSAFDIRDLRMIRGRYKAEVETNWFNNAFADIFEKKFGTHITSDADQRPEMLFRETRNLSGMDIDGTDDATHGAYVSKTVDRIQFNMPRKVFMEHGNVWVMALLRYPLIHTDEIHPLYRTLVNQNYINDFSVAAATQPKLFRPADEWLTGSAVLPTLNIKEPPFQHYRYHQNYVHPLFKETPGFPFTSISPGSNDLEWFYYGNEEYKDTFKTSQFAQWRIHGRNRVTKHSLLNPVTQNIFAGA